MAQAWAAAAEIRFPQPGRRTQQQSRHNANVSTEVNSVSLSSLLQYKAETGSHAYSTAAAVAKSSRSKTD